MMSELTLTAIDQQNVQAAIRTLLVCAPHESLIAWRLAAHRAVKRLVDGDMAMSYVGMHPFEAVLSEEAPRVSEFPSRAAPMVSRFNVFERSERLGAWSRSMLWHGHMRAFLRSSYYQDFARQLDAIDGVGLSVNVRGIHASLQIHRDSKRTAVLTDREVGLLRLLLPAFEAGIDIANSYFNLHGRPMEVLPLPDRLDRILAGTALHHCSRLTRRELEVARLLAARRSNYEIAELLHVSRATAKRHTENILQKFGLHSRREVERVIGEL
jgi:DNA-binding CsgD family transcriptional regulator